MTGKHRASRDKKPVVRWTALLFLLMMIGVGATGYLYGKALERRIQKAYSSELDKLVTAPTPGRPITFVIIGSDSRGNDRGRSDTLMVARLNPDKKTASLISIPRDTRVRIPGYGTDKINAAYSLGGVELAIQTVEEFTGIELNHAVDVDFQGFKRVVDALGGIDINVQPPNGRSRLYDPELGLNLSKGMQHLDGEEALKFVRVRHVDDDFGRTRRQQQFLRAVFEKAIKPTSLTKLPELIQIVSENVHTDSGFGLREMVTYGQLIRSMPKENVRMTTIPGDSQTIDGVSYVVPDDEKVAWLMERLNNDMPFEPTKDELANADISIEVRNGSGVGGQGRAMANLLKAKGFTIDSVGNADSYDYGKTQILTSPEDSEKARRVRHALGFGEIVSDRPGGSGLVVIVGRDFYEKNGGSASSSSSTTNVEQNAYR